MSQKLRDGAPCTVVEGKHKGKEGTVRDIRTSKTGHVTISVVQKNGERFKTLAKNVGFSTRRSGSVSLTENKTKPTGASVEDYIASRANEQQRIDCEELMALLRRVTRRPPKMWGPSIVGYGSYRYTCGSGRTGEAPLAGFAIRGRELVVYLDAEGDRQQSLLSRLGKHRMGKVCLYFRQLADLDTSVLEELVAGSIAEARRRYG